MNNKTYKLKKPSKLEVFVVTQENIQELNSKYGMGVHSGYDSKYFEFWIDNTLGFAFIGWQLCVYTEDTDSLPRLSIYAYPKSEFFELYEETTVQNHQWLIRKEPNTKDTYFIVEGTPPDEVLTVYGIANN